ncbi:MAG: DUF5682 family protein [Fuerstiella sp.]
MTDAAQMPPEQLNTDGVIDRLYDCSMPFLIGVRHHSAALAKSMDQLLDARSPEAVLLELPPEFESWIPWLAQSETVAPVALAGCPRHATSQLSFYPFADFSPELAAIRWAVRHDVPIELIDLPIAARNSDSQRQDSESHGLMQPLLRNAECQDSGQLWDRQIEARAPHSTAEQIRKAALLFGWMLRWNQKKVSGDDQRREQFMRSCLAKYEGRNVVAVIGSFHAAALLPEPALWAPIDDDVNGASLAVSDEREIATALIPYSFDQLDERSGYPAGVRDPMWHQAVWESSSTEQQQHAIADLTVSICRHMRAAGHPMNAAEAQEVVRVAKDLAIVRSYKVAGRQELLEALQLCLSQGQVYGIGKAVAAAMQTVLVGNRFGCLPDHIPRCGLEPVIDDLLQRYNLPAADTIGQQKRMRLDRLRKRLDRAREIIFQQLGVCQIPYATAQTPDSTTGRENLTSVWTLEWTNATAATIALSASKGVTLEQAARGILTSRLPCDTADYSIAELTTFETAAECGFHDLVQLGLTWITGSFAVVASLSELVQAMTFLDRLTAGHIAGMPNDLSSCPVELCQVFQLPDHAGTRPLLQAAIALLDGYMGSEDNADVRGLLDLVLWYQQQDDIHPIDAGRLLFSLRQLQEDASPLMQGAATGALLVLEQLDQPDFHQQTSSWLDAAVSLSGRQQLAGRLQATLQIIGPRLMSDFGDLHGIDERLEDYSDRRFLQALPETRKGFRMLTKHQKQNLRQHVNDRHANQASQNSPMLRNQPFYSAAEQQILYEADQAAANALKKLMPSMKLLEDFTTIPDDDNDGGDGDDAASKSAAKAGQSKASKDDLSIVDRWRLILGDNAPEMSRAACRAAVALDELYGRGCGIDEPAGAALGGRGGQEQGFPNTREWNEELSQLFPDDVREEVLGDSLLQGRNAALNLLDHDQVRPSIELLEQVLSLSGSLPEKQTETLRKLAKRITDQLAKELATKMAPALTGLTTPRPTRRRTSKLNLKKTVLSNLHTARMTSDGPRLAPEQFYFQQPAKRSLDWHIIYVLDISGSMEPSVIYSALTAAIFAGLPAVSVSFLAFNTDVIDFTGTVDDPLQMLLEVNVGGGTSIATGLQAAREKMSVPSRTIVLLITDFEEGMSVPAVLNQVQALTDSGAKALGLAALSDDGKPRYHTGIAAQVAACGMPVAALSPGQLARWVGEQIR